MIELKQIILSVIAGLLIFWLGLKFLKKSRLYPSYFILWSAIALFLLLTPVLGSFYRVFAAKVMGIYGGDHFIYVTLIGFLLVYTFYLTVKICQMTTQISRIVSTLSIIESDQDHQSSSKGS